MSRRSGPGVGTLAVLVGLMVVTSGIVVFAGTAGAQGSVLVDSDITSDTTWESGTGPYRVVRSVNVTDGATLTIESGVTVEVAEGVSLIVDGDIDVAGTAGSPVVFTSSKSDPSPGSWGSIVLSVPSSRSTAIRHATVEYATNGLALDGNQRVILESVEIHHAAEAGIDGMGSSGFAPTGEITLRNSDLHHNQFGIRGSDEKFQIVDTHITENARAGVKLENSLNVVDIRIQNATIRQNDVGVDLESSVDEHNRGGRVSDLSITDSDISENAGLGVRLFGDRVTHVRFTNSHFDGNGGSGIHVQDTGLDGGSRASTNVSVADSTFRGNGNRGIIVDAAYSDLTGVTLSSNQFSENGAAGVIVEADRELSAATLSDLQVWQNGRTGIQVGGSVAEDIRISAADVFRNGEAGISVEATNISKIDIEDSRVATNGQAGIAVRGANSGYPTSIADSTVAGNADGIVIADHAAEIGGSSIQFNDGTGIRYEGTAADPNVVSETDLYGNGLGLAVPQSATTLVADVRDNYWGATTGPHHPSINPEGEGNAVNGSLETVEFLPYAESAFGGVNERPTAQLEVSSTAVTNETAVEFDASGSTDDGEVQWYRFQANDTTDSGLTQEGTFTRTFSTPGIYAVNLTVVDDTGVPSTNNATVTINVTSAAQPTTTQSNGDGSNNGGSNNGGGDGGDGNGDGEGDGVQTPGFGVLTALLALALAVGLARRFEF